MDVQKISNDIATLKRAVKSAATASLKDKLKKKVASLTQVLKDANIPAKKLAMMLLGAKRKVASYTQAEFNEVIKRLSYKAEYSFLKGLTKVEVKDDLKREAKTPGWRFKGRNNFKTPTKSDLINDMGKPYSKRKTYYESRSNRSDVTRPAKLKTGGGVGDLVNEGDIVIWENKKYKVGKEDKEIKNFYLLNMDGTYAENSNGSLLKVHKSKLKKMKTGGGVGEYYVKYDNFQKMWVVYKPNGTPVNEYVNKHNAIGIADSLNEKNKMGTGGGLEEEDFDLFEDFDNLPKNIQDIFFEYEDSDDTYERNEEMLSRLKPLGYTFDYGLDATPYGLKKLVKGGGVGKKIIVETSKGKAEYNNQDIQEMIDNIGTYMAADNLPKWLYVTGLNGTPGFPKNKKKVIEVLEKIKNSNNDVYINVSSSEPYYKHIIKYETGGRVGDENKEMVLNNAQQIEHHAEELENAARKAKHIPAWVVAKIYNASSNISDATHYLEGVNTMPKEQYERIHAEIENNKMETGGGLNSFLDMQMAVSKICKSNGCTIKDYYLAEKKYSAGGGIGGTFDSSSTGVGIGGTDSSSKTGTPIGGTAASSMAKGGAVVGAKFKHDGKEFEVKKVQDGAVYTTNGKVYSLKTLESFGVTFNKERAKSNKPRGIRGERREEMEYQLEDLKNDLRYAKQDLRDVKRDMEEEAGEKGDNWIDADANRYGEQMNFIEEQIEALEKQIAEKEERLSYAKGGGVGETCEIFDSNGERAIDNKSIEKLTKCVTALPQTKSSNIDTNGNYTKERQKLHKEIIDKFKKDVVCIKKGKPIAVLMGGSPASGKSTFLKKYRPYLLSDSLFKVDADEIRAELPEYKGWNATQTHEETGNIVDVLISDRNVGIPCKFDFVFDGTMSSTKRYKTLINNLRKEGYDIYIVFMGNIPKEEIKERALERYKKSGRFVPMFVIEDFYANGEKNLKELKSMVDGYIVVDGSSYDYKIIEQGGKKLPNKRLYEKLGEKIKLKTGGGVQQPSYAIKLSELLNKYEPTLIGISRGMVQVTPSMAYSGAELSNMFKGFGDSMDIKNIVYRSLRDKESYPIVEKLTKGKYKLIKPTWSDNFEDYYFDNITKKEKGGGTKKEFIAKKVGKVMREFKEGDLHIGTSNKIVKNPKQAIAIALSEGKRGWKHKK
jgi:hypothetical protein